MTEGRGLAAIGYTKRGERNGALHDFLEEPGRSGSVAANPWVLGIDIGSTHVKAVALDRGGEPAYRWQKAPQLFAGTMGAFEQDPYEIEQMVKTVMAECRQQAPLSAVAFSIAMHTFVVVDERGRALTRSWTWMDRRGEAAAEALRVQGQAGEWYARTGCPVYPMSAAVKWLSLSRRTPGTRPVSLKDWLIFRLTGRWVTDYSTAAASGMMDLTGRWDGEILTTLGLDSEQMPAIAPSDTAINGYVAGGSDGAMAHYGLGVRPDSAKGVLSWGTSAAIRVTRSRVSADEFVPHGSFAYFMGPSHGYLLGQASSNAGNILAWAGGLLGLVPGEIVRVGEEMASGPENLPRFVPYLYGERSPFWNARLTGSFLGLRPEHGKAHLAGAVVVALLSLLKGALNRLEASVGRVDSLGVGESTGRDRWGQLLADMLEVPLEQSVPADASAWGAAILAADTCGWRLPPRGTVSTVIQPAANSKLQERVARQVRDLDAMSAEWQEGEEDGQHS